MSKADLILRLERLLARVTQRAGEARVARAPVEQGADSPMPAAATFDENDPGSVEIVSSRQLAVDPRVEAVYHVDPFESRERLVAAHAIGSEPPTATEPEPETAVTEAAPISSRRPLAPAPEERLADMAFGEQPQQRPAAYAPPPESGRLPASPDLDFDGDVTGVRQAQITQEPRPVLVVEPSEPPPEQEPVKRLEPEATRAAAVAVAASDRVVDVLGEAQRFAPATFAALLDASLGL